MKCQLHEHGIRDGCEVRTATDSMGPQVIIGGPKQPKHLLSPVYASHEEAVKIGNKIVVEGFELCKDWLDLNKQGPGEDLFRLAMAIVEGDSAHV